MRRKQDGEKTGGYYVMSILAQCYQNDLISCNNADIINRWPATTALRRDIIVVGALSPSAGLSSRPDLISQPKCAQL